MERLVEIGRIGGGARATILDGDLVDQEQLFDFQEKFTKLMVEVANVLPYPQGGALLEEHWPHLFQPVKGGIPR